MRILGAILAGGASRRFGSDKAEALIDGKPMLLHVAERLSVQTDGLVICGRRWSGFETADDRPIPGLGPLGGLAGALHHASANGYDLVLSSGCDLPDLPEGLIRVLSPAPSIVKGQQLIGLWDAGLAAPLETYLNKTQDYAFMGWARHCKARMVEIGQDVSNINTRSDLDAFKRREDPQSWP